MLLSLLDVLPHRFPALHLKSARLLENGELYAIGASGGEWSPGQVLEACAQACGVLVRAGVSKEKAGSAYGVVSTFQGVSICDDHDSGEIVIRASVDGQVLSFMRVRFVATSASNRQLAAGTVCLRHGLGKSER